MFTCWLFGVRLLNVNWVDLLVVWLWLCMVSYVAKCSLAGCLVMAVYGWFVS